jgi:N-acetylmuramoyl-L-alanine amidase
LFISGWTDKLWRTRTLTKFIPAYEGNYTKDRKAQGGTISEITIHHCANILTIDALGALWQREGRKGSSHYGVSETSIGQYVHEDDVAWTNGNWEANCRAVTIETSNSGGAPEWPVSDTTFQTLVTLVADIARRNGLGKLVKGKNLTWHSMYAATACPGPYLSGKLQELVDKANTINGF